MMDVEMVLMRPYIYAYPNDQALFKAGLIT